MNEERRERELLKGVLTEAHRATRRRTPAFGRVWARAAAARRPPTRYRAGRGLAAAAVALALTVTAALWTVRGHRGSELDRALTIAAALDDWQAPLDFLLATPGREWLEAPAEWPLAAPEPWALAPELLDPAGGHFDAGPSAPGLVDPTPPGSDPPDSHRR